MTTARTSHVRDAKAAETPSPSMSFDDNLEVHLREMAIVSAMARLEIVDTPTLAS
jgi:hypothetical protein